MLLEQYDGVVLDAYGVLVDAEGALPGARALIDLLHARQIPFCVATNDASRSPESCATRFASFGLEIPAHRVVTSGQLIAPYVVDHCLIGARTTVLGTSDSIAYVHDAGCSLVPLAPRIEIDALVVCDEAGFGFLPGVETAMAAVFRAIDAGRTPTLILPNPDLLYPKHDGEFGFTAGGIALLIEAALTRHFGDDAPRFVGLGKPSPRIFDLACKRLGTRKVLMVGDQIETDIVGARAAGIDAALIAGVSRWTSGKHAATPTWLLENLS